MSIAVPGNPKPSTSPTLHTGSDLLHGLGTPNPPSVHGWRSCVKCNDLWEAGCLLKPIHLLTDKGVANLLHWYFFPLHKHTASSRQFHKQRLVIYIHDVSFFTCKRKRDLDGLTDLKRKMEIRLLSPHVYSALSIRTPKVR